LATRRCVSISEGRSWPTPACQAPSGSPRRCGAKAQAAQGAARLVDPGRRLETWACCLSWPVRSSFWPCSPTSLGSGLGTSAPMSYAPSITTTTGSGSGRHRGPQRLAALASVGSRRASGGRFGAGGNRQTSPRSRTLPGRLLGGAAPRALLRRPPVAAVASALLGLAQTAATPRSSPSSGMIAPLADFESLAGRRG
jgi:hypothetical protein